MVLVLDSGASISTTIATCKLLAGAGIKIHTLTLAAPKRIGILCLTVSDYLMNPPLKSAGPPGARV